jgi:glucose-1-phosphate thymidylyltransferase
MTDNNRHQKLGREVIGLLPAGGRATRIAPLPGSKELFPVGFRSADSGRNLRPKVVCHYLLENMRLADITRVYIILRQGKWDIPAYLGDGHLLDMHLAYLMLRLPFGVPYTLDQAYPFVKDAVVALGFPDIILQPADAFVQLLSRLTETGADIVLGLFPTDQPDKADMVELADGGRVSRIEIKSPDIDLRYAWMIAVWTPAFTNYMHEYLAVISKVKKNIGNAEPEQRELFVGDVVQAAIDDGFWVDSVLFSDGFCLDIGTPENLVKAVRNGVGQVG